jgi:uncharacterized protein YoxC
VSPIVDVEPGAYDAASRVFGHKVADQLTNAVVGLKQALAGTGGMAGTDPGGTSWADAYDPSAKATTDAMTDATMASYKLAAMLEQTGFNHAVANSSSDPTQRTPTPPDTTKYVAPSTLGSDPDPPSAKGGSGHPPTGWGLIEHLVGYVWPNGDQGKLRKAGQAWTAAAGKLDTAAYDIPEALASIRAQKSPEVDDAATVCESMMTHIQDLATACRDLAQACTDLADHIDKAHKDIEDELVSLVEWTVAIEAAGAAASFFSFGAAEVPTQAAEAARIGATATRVGKIISTLVEFAGTVATRVRTVVTKIAEVAKRLQTILKAETKAADATKAAGTADKEAGALAKLESSAEAKAAEHYKELGMDPETGAYRPNEAATASSVETQRGVALTRAPKGSGVDWVGSDGKTYDAVGPFESQYFDKQWSQFQYQISRHLGKADYVPVDVSKFTPEQIAKVKEFIGPLGPRVFLVGE